MCAVSGTSGIIVYKITLKYALKKWYFSLRIFINVNISYMKWIQYTALALHFHRTWILKAHSPIFSALTSLSFRLLETKKNQKNGEKFYNTVELLKHFFRLCCTCTQHRQVTCTNVINVQCVREYMSDPCVEEVGHSGWWYEFYNTPTRYKLVRSCAPQL